MTRPEGSLPVYHPGEIVEVLISKEKIRSSEDFSGLAQVETAWIFSGFRVYEAGHLTRDGKLSGGKLVLSNRDISGPGIVDFSDLQGQPSPYY